MSKRHQLNCLMMKAFRKLFERFVVQFALPSFRWKWIAADTKALVEVNFTKTLSPFQHYQFGFASSIFQASEPHQIHTLPPHWIEISLFVRWLANCCRNIAQYVNIWWFYYSICVQPIEANCCHFQGHPQGAIPHDSLCKSWIARSVAKYHSV